MPTVALYEEAKASTVALLASLSGDDLAQTCRACPAWSIQDVVAHHVHATGTHLNDTARFTTSLMAPTGSPSSDAVRHAPMNSSRSNTLTTTDCCSRASAVERCVGLPSAGWNLRPQPAWSQGIMFDR